MSPRPHAPGATLRPSMTILTGLVLMAAGGAAAAEPGPPPRPPARAISVTASLPAQAAARPEAPLTVLGTTVAAAPEPGARGRALGTVSAAEIETANYTGGDLPPGQSALTAKVQILLDRSGISPGVVDGWRGGMSESALRAFQRRAGLPQTGRMDFAVWDLLHGFAGEPLTDTYTITPADAEGLVDRIPADYAEKAAMTSQGYTSVLERLAERFHMDERFLALMNPGIDFVPGATISVTRPASPIRASVTRIIVDKEMRRVAAYDARGTMVADYPATVGSADTPSPHGTHVVDAVALDPSYTYNPLRNFRQGQNDRILTVPPGPNGPVGDVWIDLSQPTYGIHGTATPSRLFVNQSHGCVRLTNWDARELAHMVRPGVTTVEFLAPGLRIADVAGGPAPEAAAVLTRDRVAASRPPARSERLLARIGAPQVATGPEGAPAAGPAAPAGGDPSADATPAPSLAALGAARPVPAPPLPAARRISAGAGQPQPAAAKAQPAAAPAPAQVAAETMVAPARGAEPETGPSLDAALARAEALADRMLAQQDPAEAASARGPAREDEPEYPSDGPVEAQILPRATPGSQGAADRIDGASLGAGAADAAPVPDHPAL